VTRPLVIGLAGGIGAGKSAVAAELARLGFHVIDSDQQAREALQRQEVIATLVSWWGPGILRSDGSVDRSRIAAIVFGDPGERKRLEGLIHPLVKRARAEFVQEAAHAGAPGVVVDAPLLFEAGVDRECDVVVFVDAPREQRLDRVRRTRGWDEKELARREEAQMPEAEKRRRSRYVVLNDRAPEDLHRRVEKLIEQIRATRRGSGA
jgi:dephospho-CoA kinase